MEVGDPDGYGRYGVVEETRDGLLTCAECGWVGEHLGLHAWKGHGITAAAYRSRHGLRRSKGLVAPRVRAVIQANARKGLQARPVFVARRDPAAATAARLLLALTASPEEGAARDARMRLASRATRIATVITCAWCGVQFCPLVIKRRRFCGRVCAGRATAKLRLAATAATPRETSH